jgi:transaldolase
MKIFMDTADMEPIRRAYNTGMVDGVTTNPTHIAKSGRKFKDVVKEICYIVPGLVSAEAMGDTSDELMCLSSSSPYFLGLLFLT